VGRSKPDGTPLRVPYVSKLTDFGWSQRYHLDAGIRSSYDWFLAHGIADGALRGIHETSSPEREATALAP